MMIFNRDFWNIFRNNAGYLNRKGVKHLECGKNNEALRYFNNAIRIEPQSDIIRFNRAKTLWKMGETCEAIKEYDKVLDLNPKHAQAWLYLGVIISELGRLEDALEFLNKSLEHDTHNAQTWYITGMILKKLDKSSEALKCMEMAFRIEPSLQLGYDKLSGKF